MSTYTRTITLVLTDEENDFLMAVERKRRYGLADAVAYIIRDRMYLDTKACESCGMRVPWDAEGWSTTGDDVDLCPKCWAEFVAENTP